MSGKTATFAWASSRSTSIGALADRVFDLAWTHGQVLLQQLNATEADAQLYGHLASSVIYANPLLRADASLGVCTAYNMYEQAGAGLVHTALEGCRLPV